MAAGINYNFSYNTQYCETSQATDHRQIILLEAEWRDIKKFTNSITFEKQKYDWFSLFLGATISTAIPLAYSFYTYSNSENKDLHEIVFYLISTIILLVISMCIQGNKKNKEKASIDICNELHHDNLSRKIKEIDERVKNVIPLG